MKFSEKLTMILNILECSNLRLADASSIDPSLISRLKKGTRVPVKKSIIVDKLINGICEITTELKKEKFITNKLNLNNNRPLNDEIKNWLCASDSGLRNSVFEKNIDVKNDSPKLIGRNLAELMKIFDVSNISLAKVLNVDPSLISRYKTGLRSVTVKNSIANDICNYFIKKAETNSHRDELNSLLNLDSNQSLSISIKNYLFSNKVVPSVSVIDKFLENLDTLSVKPHFTLPEINSVITPEILSDSQSIYYGTLGLRQAVRRFLSSVVVNPEPTELLLYSDQSLYWMTGDKDFSQLWSVLMIMTLMKKNKIKIIHNIDRNINEMFDAITKWLPLYLTGLIEPYSCNKGRQTRFSHTMFVARDAATVFGFFVPSNDNNAIYNYITDKDIVRKYESQYTALLKNSSPLINIFTEKNSDNYMTELLNISKTNEPSSLLTSNLAFGSIPHELLVKILKRNKVKDTEKIFACHDASKKCFENFIKNSTFTEYIVLPSLDEINEGKVKLSITGLFLEENIFYSREEFEEHLKHVRKLSSQHSSYNLKEIENIPFRNIEIFCKHNTSVIVSKTDLPAISFKFDNAFMVNAFEKYLKNN